MLAFFFLFSTRIVFQDPIQKNFWSITIFVFYLDDIFSEQEFNLFENNDGQVILAKIDGDPATPSTNREPNNFPRLSSGGRPNRPL